MEAGFQCAGCGEWNITAVDDSAGRRQSYVEDCQVCCKPNVLRLEYDASTREFFDDGCVGVNAAQPGALRGGRTSSLRAVLHSLGSIRAIVSGY